MILFDFFDYIYQLFYSIFILLFRDFNFYYDLELNCTNNSVFDYIEYMAVGNVAEYLSMLCAIITLILLLYMVYKICKLIICRIANV